MGLVPQPRRGTLPVLQVADYRYGAATWHDAARSGLAALLAAGGGTLLFPQGQSLNVNQAGHAPLLELPNDGNAGAAYPALTRGPIRIDLNGSTLVLGANTRRVMDPIQNANYDWFRDVEICNGIVDATAVPALATNEHLVFGTYNLPSPSPLNFERIWVHHIKVIGLVAGGTGGTAGRKHWLAIAPSPVLNDATQIVMREIVVEDCDIRGGDTGFVIYASSPSGGALTQPTDAVNALVENCHVARVRWDSGYTPTAFNSGGCQMGGYALVKNSSVRDSYFKGAGDVSLEVDNFHGVLVENVTCENGWNSNFLPASFGAKDDDQRNQHVVFRNCTSIVSDATLVSNQGWTGYTIRHHRLGHVELQGCRHESVALHKVGGGSGISLGLCVSTTLTQDVAPGNTTYHVATTANIVVGEDLHLGSGAGSTGEWVTVASIVDATSFTASAAVNSYDHTSPTASLVVQPTPSERITIKDFTLRDEGWNLPAAAAGATYTPIEINHQDATVEIKGVRVETQGTTTATAGALNVYGVALNGRNLTWDIDGLEVKADLVYGGAQGNYRALSLGHLSVMQPLTGRGRVRGLAPNVVQGFPVANQTGLYVADRTALALDNEVAALLLEACDFRGLANLAKEITWQTAGENVLNVLLAESNRRRNVGTWPRTVRLLEHFLGGINSSGSMGETGWTVSQSASGGVLTKAVSPVVTGHPGVAVLDAGLTAGGNVYALATGAAGSPGLDICEWFDHYFVFKLDRLDANTMLRIGMSESPVANPPLFGYWLRLLAAGTNFEFVVSNNGSTHVGTANSIAPDTNWHVLRIRRWKDAGVITVGMSLDGGTESTFTAAGDTVLPTTRAGVLFGQVSNNGGAALLTTTITHIDSTHATLGAPWPGPTTSTVQPGSLTITGTPNRTLTDVVFTNGSTAITSATAAFAVGDDGHAASGFGPQRLYVDLADYAVPNLVLV